jgi:hypothetical protein
LQLIKPHICEIIEKKRENKDKENFEKDNLVLDAVQRTAVFINKNEPTNQMNGEKEL